MLEPVSITPMLISAALKVWSEQAASAASRQLANQLTSRLGHRPASGAGLESALRRELEREPTFGVDLREWLLRSGAIDPLTASDFASSRIWIKEGVGGLIEETLEAHKEFRESDDVPLLTRPGWIPASPLPLHPERVTLRRMVGLSDSLEPARHRLRELGYWPVVGGSRIPTYHDAIHLLDKPPIWHNGTSYRLMDVDPKADTVRLIFNDEPGHYFDMMDTGEPLAFEAAWQARSSLPAAGPYRSWLADPFNFAIRCAVPGVNVLTVRRSKSSTLFYLHERVRVGLSAGTNHVVPAGEFQPASDWPRALENDFDLFHVITREYAEEFCGIGEAREQEASPIDYRNDQRYAPIYRALTEGRVLVRYLGIGLYPLTWKPEILIVCVFDDATFDRLFRGLKSVDIEARNTEGGEGQLHRPPTPPGSRLKNRKDKEYGGWDFGEETVRYWRDKPTTLPAGRACLGLAWRHRMELGLG